MTDGVARPESDPATNPPPKPEMWEVPRYATCAKCSWSGSFDEPHKVEWSLSWVGTEGWGGIELDPETLVVTCTVCGFKWGQEPFDVWDARPE